MEDYCVLMFEINTVEEASMNAFGRCVTHVAWWCNILFFILFLSNMAKNPLEKVLFLMVVINNILTSTYFIHTITLLGIVQKRCMNM